MVVMALLVLGYTSFIQMDVDLFPDVDIPVVSVTAVYPGAGPEAIESEVTIKIEDAINPVAGVDHIQSISGEGYSLVVARFKLETDGPTAAQEVREKIAAIRADLPNDIEEPVIARFDFASEPIISLVIFGDRPLKELTEYARTTIKRKLESISGVGAVRLTGGALREILVELDPRKLEEFGFSVQQVNAAIMMANLDIPSGKIERGERELILRTAGKIQKVSDFDNVIISNSHGRQTYLSEIAAVYDTTERAVSLARYNGNVSVGLEIIRQSGANTVKVADDVMKAVDDVRATLPQGMDIDVVKDESIFIRDSIHDVLINIFYGGALAVFVIFIFLADIRSTIISAIAIPTSIIATFTLMRMLGFTINFMSLLALSLAVGLLIDDAIVVIENIYRHLAMGKSPMKAAADATGEIGLAVSATTFSIVVVFLPVAFMSGIVGRFFYQFGMSVAFAVVVSLFIAFTLTPMLSSKFLKVEGEQTGLFHRLFGPWNRLVQKFGRIYFRILRWSLGHRFLVLLIATIMFIISLGIGSFLGSEFMSRSDRNELTINFEAPSDFSLEATARITSHIEQIIRKHPEVTDLLTSIGSGNNPSNEGYIYVKLVDKSKRDISDMELVSMFRAELSQIPGVEFAIFTQAGEGGAEKPVEISVRGPAGPRLQRLGDWAYQTLRSIPYAADVASSEKASKPEYRIDINRRAASDLGLSVGSIAMTLRSLIEGSSVSKFREGDEEYDIRVRVPEKNVGEIGQINNLYLPSEKQVNDKNIQVPLGRVAEVVEFTGPTELRRLDRMREIRIGANIEYGGFQGNIAKGFEAAQQGIDVPAGYFVGTTGSTEMMNEAFRNIFMALFLAIVFIYLLLASQFEHFLDPLAIMLSLPLSIVGALLGLLAFNSSISIMSLIGVVMLMGLVTKNAILLIDFAKQRRARGMGRSEALLDAGQVRLRPILMTTFAMIFGMLPLALAIGPGAEMRAPMARAVIGGLVSSTLLTLVVVPVVYSILDDFTNSRVVTKLFRLRSHAGTTDRTPDVTE